MSASVQTGRARPKVSTTSRVTLGTKLSLSSRKLKQSKLRIFVIKNSRIFWKVFNHILNQFLF